MYYIVCYATDERIVLAQRVNESRCVTFWPTTAAAATAAAALLLLYEHPAAFQPGLNYVTPLYYRPVYIRGLCGPRLDTREQRFNRIAPQPRNDICSLPLPSSRLYIMEEESLFIFSFFPIYPCFSTFVCFLFICLKIEIELFNKPVHRISSSSIGSVMIVNLILKRWKCVIFFIY